MKNKIIVIILIILIIFSLILYKVAKNSKIGNNSTSQEIVNYILNISSYEAEIDVEIQSNKNSNKYKIKQKYKSSEDNSQEVIEPSNIEGVKIVRKANQLSIENTRLSLTKIIEDYKELTENILDLGSFIKDYKENKESKFKEEKNQIIMETTSNQKNKYQKYEAMYIERKTGTPTKIEIKDTNQNVIVHIIYKKIEID